MFHPIAFALAIALPVPPVTPDLPSITGAMPLQVQFPANGGPGIAFAGPARINRLHHAPLPPEAQRDFDTVFQSAGYFGAFALSKDDAYGYSSGAGSLQAAREIAMAQCLSVATTCAIVAELMPEGYVPPPPGAITLSQQVYGHFIDAGSNPDFQARAVSEDGAFSMYWGVTSMAEAERLAITDCESSRDRSLPGLRDMPCILVTNLP